jgi:hypothetical protein
MRTTLIIDEHLLQKARELTGIQEKTALVRAGLEALIAREAAKPCFSRWNRAESARHSQTAFRIMVLADTSFWIEHFRQGQSGACRTVNGSGRFDPSFHCW